MKVGIIGAGVMGTGVSQDLLQHNIDVVLADINEQILEKVYKQIEIDIHMYNLFTAKGSINEKTIMEKLKLTTDLSDMSDVDFIIENVNESYELKKSIYVQIDKIAKTECIFAVNTSCISITKLGNCIGRPDKVVGTHFMNPVPYKKYVEMIRGYHTSDETIAKMNVFFESIGKESILVNDYPGFVSNRLSHLLMNEAAWVVQDGVAAPEDVDKIFTECFGHKMGPLATADLIGLDTVVDSLNVLYGSYHDPKFRCCPLLQKMVDANKLGKKTNEGFFDYY